MKKRPGAILTIARNARATLLPTSLPAPRATLSRCITRRALSVSSQHFVNLDGARVSDQTFSEPFFRPSGELGVAESDSSRETVTENSTKNPPVSTALQLNTSISLPVSCPGCGALSQEVDHIEAGHYTRSRKAVRGYLRQLTAASQTSSSYDVSQAPSLSEVSNQHAGEEADGIAETETHEPVATAPSLALPVCDRCHDLIYNGRGVSISHPSIESLADSLAESPFTRNHVYHVLDAADFPLSLVPSIYQHMSVVQPRTQNRRSQHKFSKRPTISFIITRSDLLAPTKEKVDSLMPYFTSVLRTALGRFGRKIRLGNVHLVSSKRGWWTREIKENIWQTGGGNWLVGKVNVGKSNLFEVIFPKGSGDRAVNYAKLEEESHMNDESAFKSPGNEKSHEDFILFSETSLLPPPQPETPFPSLPLVSSLPGTTASPIRLPFGNHKGELVDLPGLERGNLDAHIHPDHKLDIIMMHRPTVTQHIIKAGQSLLLGGGLVRITPVFDPNVPEADAVMMAYPFVPVDAHVTATEKAVGTQLQQRESGIKSILAEGAGEKINSAGHFTLDTDVTKARAGALVRAGVRLENLPFRVVSTDILIEGMGWVELVCQVRRSRKSRATDAESSSPSAMLSTADATDANDNSDDQRVGDVSSHVESWNPFGDPLAHLNDAPKTAQVSDATPSHWSPLSEASPGLVKGGFSFPTVEIFTPEGKSISKRVPMGAWMLTNRGKTSPTARKTASAARPRKPMKGTKKREKLARREKNTSQRIHED